MKKWAYINIIEAVLVMVLVFSLSNCERKNVACIDKCPDEIAASIYERDSVLGVRNAEISALSVRVHQLADSSSMWEKQRDSINELLKLSNFNVEKLKKYGLIVARNPSQVVFLKGWINRVK